MQILIHPEIFFEVETWEGQVCRVTDNLAADSSRMLNYRRSKHCKNPLEVAQKGEVFRPNMRPKKLEDFESSEPKASPVNT
jgi:hypothetical protein